MFALSLVYPLGRVYAAEAGEPPAWSRLYSALIAGAYRGGLMPAAREVLLWLEELGPPSIADSPSTADTTTPRYVPANDDARLPRARHRTARTFESAVLAERDLDFQYIWPDAQVPESMSALLDEMCAAVTHVGTTHALALVNVLTAPRSPDWIPAETGGEISVRTILPGRLDESDRIFESGRRLHGGACEAWTPYRRPRNSPSTDPGRVVVLRLDGHLAAEHAIHLSAALMAALQAEIPDSDLETVAAGVHGHRLGDAGRLRIIPLPDVGHRHASGHVLGVALDMDQPDMRTPVLSALTRLGPLMLPGEKRVTLRALPLGRPVPLGLQIRTWVSPSRTWTTALAAVIDRFPKKGFPLESAVRLTCENAGLPAPIDIQVQRGGFLRGVGDALDYALRQKQQGPRAHLLLRFAEPLRPEAPLSLGRGRNYGLGLLRPLPDQEEG